MAERVVSPGVFTRERDLTFLEQGVANIGGAFIGVTQKGPAYIPTIVENQSDFENRFGKADEYSYLGYTVQNYLQEAQSATVVRVLGQGGYEGAQNLSAKLIVSGTDAAGTAGGAQRVLAIFHPTISGSLGSNVGISSASISGTTSSMAITLSSSNAISAYTGVSARNAGQSGNNTIRDSISSSPTSTGVAYVYSYFPNAVDKTKGGVSALGDMILSQTGADATVTEFNGTSYSNASTPWIESQLIGSVRFTLFKAHTLADGTNSNRAVKISIHSIQPQVSSGSFGTFTLAVRKSTDTDESTEVLEEWLNLTMDPNSSDYIARRIGDSAPYTDTTNSDTPETYYQGDYPNHSKYIRIELSEDAKSGALGEVVVPYGFQALNPPYRDTDPTQTPPQIIDTAWQNSTVGWGAGQAGTDVTYKRNRYYGFDYADTNYTNQSYLAPIPNAVVTAAQTVNYVPLPSSSTHYPATVARFSLDNLRSGEVNGTDVSLSNRSHVTYRKFTVPMQGGFDGYAPNRITSMGTDITAGNTQGFDLTTSTSSGSVAFKKAIDAVRNPESFDINLLAIPGVNYEQHSYIAQYAIDMCEERQDCFYIMDLAAYTANISSAITTASTTDSNYAAGWYPWVKVRNTNTNRFIWAPPSVVLPEVFAYNDNIAAEWFAPAGLNRGGIPGAIQAKTRLTRSNRDELYENKVNPIATFPGQGIVAWGQKTLQKKASALDRINVRRLLIALKKFVASSSRYLVFEQNTEATRNRFLNIVNPYLASVQERQGLYAFRVIMDETNNTSDVIDRNQLVGQIYLQPARAAEFIILDFNIMPTGATFPGA